MKRNKKFIITLLLIASGAAVLTNWNEIMDNQNSYQLDEPMLISSNKGESYYMLPTNTVLHFKKGFPEGHQLYTIQVFAKGKLPATKISASTPVESTWIYPIDAEDVTKILSQNQLSKNDLIRILKARKMTRDDLAQIVREWKDD